MTKRKRRDYRPPSTAVRLPDKLLEQVRALAKNENRTLPAQLEFMLWTWFRERAARLGEQPQ